MCFKFNVISMKNIVPVRSWKTKRVDRVRPELTRQKYAQNKDKIFNLHNEFKHKTRRANKENVILNVAVSATEAETTWYKINCTH